MVVVRTAIFMHSACPACGVQQEVTLAVFMA
jgi:hypothetical protein